MVDKRSKRGESTRAVKNKSYVEYIPLEDIQRWPRNPKLHDSAALVRSVERFGFVQPLVMDERTGQLVAGHGRLEALARMHAEGKSVPARVTVSPKGDWLVPVIRGVSFRNAEEAEAYLLADNRLVERGGWDTDALDQLLREQYARTPNDVVGWSPAELAALVATAPVPVAPPNVNSGGPPEEKLEGYLNNGIRQVVLHYGLAEYEEFVAVAEKIRTARGLESNSELLLTLLREADRATPAT